MVYCSGELSRDRQCFAEGLSPAITSTYSPAGLCFGTEMGKPHQPLQPFSEKPLLTRQQ
ncbi:MAG: hypothetical protein LBE12_03230 [Planctomycetaceae bacterium]|nr:hypothetical protein [Planctomycetaceae bacterium]